MQTPGSSSKKTFNLRKATSLEAGHPTQQEERSKPGGGRPQGASPRLRLPSLAPPPLGRGAGRAAPEAPRMPGRRAAGWCSWKRGGSRQARATTAPRPLRQAPTARRATATPRSAPSSACPARPPRRPRSRRRQSSGSARRRAWPEAGSAG